MSELRCGRISSLIWKIIRCRTGSQWRLCRMTYHSHRRVGTEVKWTNWHFTVFWARWELVEFSACTTMWTGLNQGRHSRDWRETGWTNAPEFGVGDSANCMSPEFVMFQNFKHLLLALRAQNSPKTRHLKRKIHFYPTPRPHPSLLDQFLRPLHNSSHIYVCGRDVDRIRFDRI